jgi:hypothetical protein
LHVTFGLTVEILYGFEDFSPSLGMLSPTMNVGKSAQNCPKLPNSTQRQNFGKPPKIKILVFFKIKISTWRGGTKACFHCLDFQSKNFSYAIFIVKKRPLYVNFSIPPCGK